MFYGNQTKIVFEILHQFLRCWDVSRKLGAETLRTMGRFQKSQKFKFDLSHIRQVLSPKSGGEKIFFCKKNVFFGIKKNLVNVILGGVGGLIATIRLEFCEYLEPSQ